MMNKFFKTRSAYSWILLLGLVLSVVGLVIYILNSTTGYLAGQDAGVTVIVLSVISLLSMLVLFFMGDKVKKFRDTLFIVSGVFIVVSICLFAHARVSVAADVWFIPVNYPPAEGTTLTVAIVGIVFYVLSLICVLISAFGSNLSKEIDTVTTEKEA